MDTDKKLLATNNSESSLTESWNVIEAQEVNVSEGSDGESIEVIDEESQNTDSNPPSIEEIGSNTECCETSRSEDEDQALLTNYKVVQADFENCDSTVTEFSESETSGGISLFNTCGLLVLCLAILCTGATVSVFLLKVEELALGSFSYFRSSKPTQSNDKEYQELLNQIKTYKEESTDLKNLISDLNSAVLSLKKELAFQKSTTNSGIDKNELNVPHEVGKEDSLFQQILNVHTNNYSQANNSDQEKEMPYENSFRAIKEVLLTFSSEYKKEDEMETIRVFSQIPKHLSVLANFDSSNQNINKFIELWEDKLLRVNEKLIFDIKQMQLKMTRHIIKSLRTTQKNFFEKLCELKDMKKPQCYDTFIKPYQSFDSFSLPRAEDKNQQTVKTESCSNAPKKQNPTAGDQVKSNFDYDHPSNLKKKTKIKEKDLKEGRLNEVGIINSQNIENSPVISLSVENLNEKNVESHSVPGISHGSAPPIKNPQGKNNYKAQLNNGKNKDKILRKEKGMNSDLFQEDPSKSGINSFSSFSETKNGEGEGSERKQQEGSKHSRYEEFLDRRGEGSWFLRMGNHRSRIRHSKERGDWLFERARYRRRRNLHCRQVWFSKIPGNVDNFSPDFLKSQGFI